MKPINQPLVSIIIPAHNVSRYLKTCVESVSSGYYKNIEIILVENGSEDTTGIVCDQLATADERICVFHMKGVGVSRARNYGIDKSHGDYICFIDADDFVSIDYIQYLVSLILRKNVNIAVATNILTFYKFGDSLDKSYNSKIVETVGTSEDALEKILLYKMTVVSCFSKIFKKSFLEQNRIYFNDSLFIGEGFNFNVLAFSNAEKIAFSNKPIYFYRVSNPNSAMTKVEMDKIRNGLLALKYLDKTLIVRSDRIDKALKYAEWHTNFDFLMQMLSSNEIRNNMNLFNDLVRKTKNGRQVSKSLEIGLKERMKAYCASINPILAGNLINHLRKRKTVE